MGDQDAESISSSLSSKVASLSENECILWLMNSVSLVKYTLVINIALFVLIKSVNFSSVVF